MAGPNAGVSTCPLCRGRWLVTPQQDCILPSCGCFGGDVSANNPNRPHVHCGMIHWANCPKRGENYPEGVPNVPTP